MRLNPKLLLIGILLVSFALLSVVVAQQMPTQPNPAPKPVQASARLNEITSRLERDTPTLMREADVPGLSIALVRNGEVVWHHAFGLKDSKTKEPATENTVFEAASLSKPVFAYAVMKLVDAGKFELDKPLNQYLPGD